MNSLQEDAICVRDCIALFPPATHATELSQCLSGCYATSTSPTGNTTPPTGGTGTTGAQQASAGIPAEGLAPLVMIGLAAGAIYFITKK